MMMMMIIIDVISIAPYPPVNGEHTALYKTKINANRKPNFVLHKHISVFQ